MIQIVFQIIQIVTTNSKFHIRQKHSLNYSTKLRNPQHQQGACLLIFCDIRAIAYCRAASPCQIQNTVDVNRGLLGGFNTHGVENEVSGG